MNFPMNIEQWRLISGYDNYEISSHGRVRNNKSKNILKTYTEKAGYVLIGLYKDGKTKTHRIHRLVGFAFLEKKDGDIEVDHIDHNRANNNYENLRWTTHSGNMRNKSTSKTNTSGTSGVCYDNQKGLWVASWCDQNMKYQRKRFSVKKLGDEQAKQLAINYRKQMAEENGYLNV